MRIPNQYVMFHIPAPRRKKLNSTTDYIYTALFVEQRNSDVAVRALGKVWNLHKIYLCQSPYFASLFSGSWRERASDAYANVEVVDPQVTLDGLDVVFGSLYNNEVTIDPKQVVAVLAAATLFQLEGLIERCGEVMVETITAEVSFEYIEWIFERYGGMFEAIRRNAIPRPFVSNNVFSESSYCLEVSSVTRTNHAHFFKYEYKFRNTLPIVDESLKTPVHFHHYYSSIN